MDSCERVNYKSVVRLLQKKYPSIFEELTQEPVVADLTMAEPLLGRFCLLKGLSKAQVVKNKDQSRMLFIALATKTFDPLFFVDTEKTLLRGLRDTLAAILFIHETQISHTLTTVRTYLRAYPDFRKEVDYLYATIVKEFSHDNRKYQNSLHGGRQAFPLSAEPENHH